MIFLQIQMKSIFKQLLRNAANYSHIQLLLFYCSDVRAQEAATAIYDLGTALHCTALVENVKICKMCKNCRLGKICKICQMAGKRRWTKTLEFENKEENVPAAVRSCQHCATYMCTVQKSCSSSNSSAVQILRNGFLMAIKEEDLIKDMKRDERK